MQSGKTIRIGIDLYGYDPSYSGGVGTFARGLVEGLLDNNATGRELVLLASLKNEAMLNKQYRGRNIRIVRVALSPMARYVNRLIVYLSWGIREYRLRYWYELLFRKQVQRQIEAEVDALIVPTTTFNFYALQVPTILCIHDIQQEYHPENFTFHERILRWAPYRLSASLATTIQVSSKYIMNCLLEKFPFLSPDCFLMAREGVDAVRFSDKGVDQVPQALPDAGRKGFVFYPAQMWPHKNHSVLMHALALVRERLGYELPCVLTGYDYGHWSEIERLQASLGLESVFYLGRVDFPELLWLYKHCDAVLALGVHESSSLPVREGAAFGKPLICADIEPNIEASEYLHLNLFKKNQPESLAGLLMDLHDNIGDIQAVAEKNKTVINSLGWELIARQYIDRFVADVNSSTRN